MLFTVKDRGGVAGQRGHARHGGGVYDVVLASAAAGQLPHSCGSRAWHVIDLLTAGGQPPRHVPAS